MCLSPRNFASRGAGNVVAAICRCVRSFVVAEKQVEFFIIINFMHYQSIVGHVLRRKNAKILQLVYTFADWTSNLSEFDSSTLNLSANAGSCMEDVNFFQ